MTAAPQSPPDRSEPVQRITGSLRFFVAGVLVASLQAAEGTGLNASDLGCLCLLLLHGPAPAGRLAELTGLTTGAITGVIDRLERAGFISRESDPHDRRRVIVTPKISKIERDLMPHFVSRQPAATPAFYDQYSAAELELIADFMTRVADLG